jgi:hypothetical protein
LFGCQPQAAKVVAETAVLAYELDRRALGRLFDEEPELINTFARSLALLAWRESKDGIAGVEPEPAAIERLTHLHHGQIEAAYHAETPAVLLGPVPVSA